MSKNVVKANLSRFLGTLAGTQTAEDLHLETTRKGVSMVIATRNGKRVIYLPKTLMTTNLDPVMTSRIQAVLESNDLSLNARLSNAELKVLASLRPVWNRFKQIKVN